MVQYFATVKSYADVPCTYQGIETSSFLEASDGLVGMFDLLGMAVFEFLRSDLMKNISGLRVLSESPGITSNTLENLITSGTEKDQDNAKGFLTGLIRVLSLTCKALQYMQEDAKAELYTCFQKSYDEVLRPHYSWVISSFVYLALRSLPHRRDFYNSLQRGDQRGDQERFDAELARWLAGLDKIVKHMSSFLLEQGGFGQV